MNNYYTPYTNVVLRSPYYSLDKYFQIFENVKNTESYLQALQDDKTFQELLALSSQDLFKEITSNANAITSNTPLFYSCMKYMIRSASRCTPYGLCAGVSMATLAKHTNIQLSSKQYNMKYARVDMAWLLAVIEKIAADKNVLPYLEVSTNSYTYVNGIRVINPWYVNFKESDCLNTFNSIRNTSLVKYILSLSEKPILFKDLQEKIQQKYPNVSDSKINGFLNILIENEFLLLNILPPLINSDPLKYLLTLLKDIPSAYEWYEKLSIIQKLIDKYAQASSESSIFLYKQLCTLMSSLNISKNYIQVDLKKQLNKDSLSNEIAKEAQEYITLLCELADLKYEPNNISTFKNKFIEKYGFDVAISILEVFDNDLGIGAPFDYTAPLTTQKGVIPKTSKSNLEIYLNQKIHEAINKNESEVFLTSDELAPFKNKTIETDLLPESLELCFEVVSKNLTALDSGEFQLIPTGFIMSDYAEKSFGRFCHMFKEFDNSINAPDIATVEICEYPAHKRNCNVLLCNSTAKYQLNLNIPKTGSINNIDIHDIYIGIDSTTNKFYIKSNKLNKRLSIRCNNLFNSKLGSNIYRFLEENNALPALPLIQSYYSFLSFSQPYVPRILYKRIIIAPAQWRLPHKTTKDGVENLRAYIKEWNIPRFVYFIKSDNKILLDLNNDYHLNLLYDIGHKTKDGIILIEAIDIRESHWLKDTEGHSYQNEIILSFYKNEVRKIKPSIMVPAVLNNKNSLNDICPTQYEKNTLLAPTVDGWIYLKLYCNSNAFDEIISKEIHEWCSNLYNNQILEKYFFIRYSDPNNHIRLRLKFYSDQHEYIPRILEWINYLREHHFILNLQISSYCRETWRYGGKNAIPLAESIFFRDSQLIEEIILKRTQLSLSEDMFGIINILSICYAFGLQQEDILLWLSEQISPSRYRKDFQNNRISILNTITDFINNDILLKSIDFTARNNAIKDYKQLLDILDDKGELTASKSNILSSLIHMSLNRFKGNNIWEEKIRALTRHGLYAFNQKRQHSK